jgi:hypothetical protein
MEAILTEFKADANTAVELLRSEVRFFVHYQKDA